LSQVKTRESLKAKIFLNTLNLITKPPNDLILGHAQETLDQ
jgi:hypothetical protein